MQNAERTLIQVAPVHDVGRLGLGSDGGDRPCPGALVDLLPEHARDLLLASHRPQQAFQDVRVDAAHVGQRLSMRVSSSRLSTRSRSTRTGTLYASAGEEAMIPRALASLRITFR